VKDIIQSIQQDILNSNESLANILLKAKVLAHQLKNNEFKRWVKNELDGYDEVDVLPDYRILELQSRGTFFNGAWKYEGCPIALHTVPPKLRDCVNTMHVVQGVHAIEEMAQKENLVRPWPGDLVAYFNSHKVYDTYNLIEAHSPILGSNFAQILQTARSRLQDFILEISDLSWNMGSELLSAEKIGQLFQLTIHNNIQGSNMSTFDQRGQQVQNQYNAARDVNIGSIQNQTVFLQELQKIKDEVSRAGEAKILIEDVVVDVEYEITKASQETKKTEPKKAKILEHMSKAKTLLEGTVATTGLATALMKLIEAAQNLF
jgi:AbiTii